jgi:hypothetical protein
MEDLMAYPFATPELNWSDKAGEGRILWIHNRGEMKKT